MLSMSGEAAATPLPRKGRIRVILVLAVVAAIVGYVIVDIATKPPGRDVVRVEGIGAAQQIFGGVPQEEDRVGSDNAPVSIQLFSDLQCGDCRDDFLAIVPALVTEYARPGDVKLLLRHYSAARNSLELGFFGAEAAARQGYGWNYTYLFFRNQGEANHFGVNQDFLDSVASGVEKLDGPEWEAALEQNGGPDGPIARRLKGYEELGRSLGIRVRQAAIVSGPNGTITLQDGPKLSEIEKAIAEVE